LRVLEQFPNIGLSAERRMQ